MKRMLKRLRTWEPLNHAVTTPLRKALDLTGTQSDWVMKYLPRSGEVRTVLPDGKVLRLFTRCDEWIGNTLFWRGLGGYEPEMVDPFYRLARRSAVVFDIGAHVGVYSVLAAFANPEGSVHAFEPLAPVFARLQHNLAINQVQNVRCDQAAAGATDGMAEFFIAGDGVPSASSLSREYFCGSKTESCRVRVVALDSYVRANGLARVDLVKIDTESTEPDVLRGMARTLERDHPTIFCEVLSWRDTGGALAEVLDPFGYKYYHLGDNGPVACAEIQGHDVLRNYLFTTAGPEELSGLLGLG